MQLHVGCEFTYESTPPTPAVALVQPRTDLAHTLLNERWQIRPHADRHEYRDLFGNRCERFTLSGGNSTIRYDALVDVTAEADPVDYTAPQHEVENLPDETLVYTLASRYCLTETLSQVAWHLFSWSTPGWQRVQAVCDWVHNNIRYGLITSTPMTTAVDVYAAGGGMCRDFAHLAITFCRALNIPARYVFGYMPDIGIPGPFSPMDFHAWFEVYLGDRWWTFDARFNKPRIGRVPIGIGRDAVDVAMVTTYGPAIFKEMTVWAELFEENDLEFLPPATTNSGLARSEGLMLARNERRIR